MKKISMLLFLIMVSLPFRAISGERPHIATPETQECSECHVDQDKVWFEGKHGLMNVKCVVCHGSLDQNFRAKPAITQCRGCHSQEVEQVMKRTASSEKTCFPCHDHHSLVVKTSPKAPFHAKGGK